MSLATVRGKIATILGGVAGIGQVHDYFRHVTTMAELTDRFKKDGRLHFWCVSLSGSNPFTTINSQGLPGRNPANHEFGRYLFNIHGYYALKDSEGSEKVFQDLVEDVIDAFRSNKTLDNTVIDSGPLQWVEGGGPEAMRMMPPGEGGVLCHYARLELAAKERTE